MFCSMPILPVFLIMYDGILMEASKTYKVSISLIGEVKYNVAQFIQGDLALESHLQVIISVVLLLLTNSNTRTIVGLDTLFDNDTFLYLPTNLALALSILWSMYSCIRSHIKGIHKRQEHATTKATMMIILFTATSIAIRVFTYVMYLTPTLGLFHILTHLQGEMYPFEVPYINGPTVLDQLSNGTFYYGNATPIPWSQITRWKYIEYRNAEPPKLNLYTKFSHSQYFAIMFSTMILQLAMQLILKKVTNPKVFHKLSYIDLVIHGISSCFIPHPMKEWSEDKGNVKMHRLRRDIVFKEVLASMMINFGFNLFLLSPLILLGKLQMCIFIRF